MAYLNRTLRAASRGDISQEGDYAVRALRRASEGLIKDEGPRLSSQVGDAMERGRVEAFRTVSEIGKGPNQKKRHLIQVITGTRELIRREQDEIDEITRGKQVPAGRLAALAQATARDATVAELIGNALCTTRNIDIAMEQMRSRVYSPPRGIGAVLSMDLADRTTSTNPRDPAGYAVDTTPLILPEYHREARTPRVRPTPEERQRKRDDARALSAKKLADKEIRKRHDKETQRAMRQKYVEEYGGLGSRMVEGTINTMESIATFTLAAVKGLSFAGGMLSGALIGIEYAQGAFDFVPRIFYYGFAASWAAFVGSSYGLEFLDTHSYMSAATKRQLSKFMMLGRASGAPSGNHPLSEEIERKMRAEGIERHLDWSWKTASDEPGQVPGYHQSTRRPPWMGGQQ